MIETLPQLVDGILLQTEPDPVLQNEAMAALAVGLAAIGTGLAQREIGSAAMGAIAEDSDNFTIGLILTALPETLIIIALVTIFVV